MLMFVVLSIGLLTALTTTISVAAPTFADKKKCEDNDNNNCNDTHKTQKIDQENKCKIENENEDHSSDNGNLNSLACVNIGANLKDVALINIFGTDNVRPTAQSEQNGQSGQASTQSGQ